MSTLLRRWAGPLVVAAAGVTMAAATWGTWPDPVTDFGKEIYIAWQLSLGRHLYQDVAYHLGPLSPYANALAFKIFGPTLASIEWLNLFLLAVTTALIYRLLRAMAGPFAATIAGILFMTLFAFTHFTPIADYNFICPYDHAHTHGLLLGLAALTAADCYVRRGKPPALIAAGLFLGLAFLTRAELFLAAAAGEAMVLLVGWMYSPTPRKRSAITPTLQFVATFLLPIIIAWVLLATVLPAHLAWRGIAGSWPIVFDHTVAANQFYRDSMGTWDIAASLWRLTRWTLCWCAIVLPAIGLSRLTPHRLWIITAFFLGALIAYLAGHFQDPADAFTPLPLALVVCAWLLKRKNRMTPLSIGLITWAFVLLGKIILNARIYHYGFALAMPATLLVAAVAVGIPKPPVRAAVLGALLITIMAYLSLAFRLIGQQHYPVGDGPNQFWADDRGRMLNDCLKTLQQNASPAQTLAVMPEGAMLNFLSKMTNPTPYWSFNPPYAFFAPGEGEVAGEQKILKSLEQTPPDWITLLAEDLSDFGAPFFGRDYGRNLYAFTRRYYHPVFRVGDPPFTGGGFGAILLRRQGYNEQHGLPPH